MLPLKRTQKNELNLSKRKKMVRVRKLTITKKSIEIIKNIGNQKDNFWMNWKKVEIVPLA